MLETKVVSPCSDSWWQRGCGDIVLDRSRAGGGIYLQVREQLAADPSDEQANHGIRPIWGFMAALLLGLIVVAIIPWISIGFL